jgi:hypothetical protein
MKLLGPSPIMENDKMVIFQPTCEEDVTIKTLSYLNSTSKEYIKLVNVKVDLSQFELNFSNKKKVYLESCEFTGGSKFSIHFHNCEEVILSNCCLSNFTTYTIRFSEVKNMLINNSKFKNCYYYHYSSNNDWAKLGGILHLEPSNSKNKIYINASKFVNCGGRNRTNYYRSAFISNCVSEVNDTQFENCWHYFNNDCVDPLNERRTMFPTGSTAIRCVYENSAEFSYT